MALSNQRGDFSNYNEDNVKITDQMLHQNNNLYKTFDEFKSMQNVKTNINNYFDKRSAIFVPNQQTPLPQKTMTPLFFNTNENQYKYNITRSNGNTPLNINPVFFTYL